MRNFTFFTTVIAVLGWTLLPSGKLSACESQRSAAVRDTDQAFALATADDVIDQTSGDTSTEEDAGDMPDDEVEQPRDETDKEQAPAVATFDHHKVEVQHGV